MDEVLRDLVVIGLIGLLIFVGAVEYVYWRFGLDKLLLNLQRIELHMMHVRIHTGNAPNALSGRKVA